ncbi:MAG: AAA family ATPase [Candidatus Micrarchaeota archaeon]
MANIFGGLDGEKSVFRDERVLTPDYLPNEMCHRDSQIKEMALILHSVVNGRKPENMLLVGPTGTGKTSCTRHVLKQLSEYSKRALPIYINCWELSTRHAILNKLASSLGEIIPRRGVATDEVTDKISEFLLKEKRAPVIALDEIDRLVASQYGEESILYDLARSSEVFGAEICIIGITNHSAFLSKLDSRITSSLSQHRLEFKRYSPIQLKDILKERARFAFSDGSLDKEAIPFCAAIGAKNGGDARIAIAVLWRAGKLADRKGSPKVTVAHVKAIAYERTEHEHNTMLEPLEKKILEIVRANPLTSGELYKSFKSKSITDRTIRNHLTKLEKLGLVETEVKADRGRTRVIKSTGK